MDSQFYIKFVVVDFFFYTKFEYFDHFIDKKRVDMTKFKQNIQLGRPSGIGTQNVSVLFLMKIYGTHAHGVLNQDISSSRFP